MYRLRVEYVDLVSPERRRDGHAPYMAYNDFSLDKVVKLLEVSSKRPPFFYFTPLPIRTGCGKCWVAGCSFSS